MGGGLDGWMLLNWSEVEVGRCHWMAGLAWHLHLCICPDPGWWRLLSFNWISYRCSCCINSAGSFVLTPPIEGAPKQLQILGQNCSVVRQVLGNVQLIYLTIKPAGGIPNSPTTVIRRVSTISLKVRRVSRLINANYEKRLPSSFSLYKRSSHFDFHIAMESQGKNTKNKSNKYTKAGKTKAPKRENNGKHFTGLSLSLLPPNRNGPRRSCSFSRLH